MPVDKSFETLDLFSKRTALRKFKIINYLNNHHMKKDNINSTWCSQDTLWLNYLEMVRCKVKEKEQHVVSDLCKLFSCFVYVCKSIYASAIARHWPIAAAFVIDI